jgi:hypothetical protein
MLFVVTQDERPIQHGFTTWQSAWLVAKKHEEEYLRHRDNDKRRVPEFGVAEDKQDTALDNLHYRQYKEGDTCLHQ